MEEEGAQRVDWNRKKKKEETESKEEEETTKTFPMTI